MIELEALTRSINGLTELLRVARSDLANPILTPFERRELGHQIRPVQRRIAAPPPADRS